MAITYHLVNFLNKTLDMLTGAAVGGAYSIAYANPYSGAQTADPSVAPSGSFVWANYLDSISLIGMFGAASSGSTLITATCSPVVAANAAAVIGITTVRFYNSSGAALFDIPATDVLDTLTSLAGVGCSIVSFCVSIPTINGTVKLNASLANRIVDLWTGVSTTIPEIGGNTSGTSNLVLYSGSIPADADTTPSGTTLATIPLTTNVFHVAGAITQPPASDVGASAFGNANLSVNASSSGSIAYFRFEKSQGADLFKLQGIANLDYLTDGMQFDSATTTTGVAITANGIVLKLQ
jgi:hypothetical protein